MCFGWRVQASSSGTTVEIWTCTCWTKMCLKAIQHIGVPVCFQTPQIYWCWFFTGKVSMDTLVGKYRLQDIHLQPLNRSHVSSLWARNVQNGIWLRCNNYTFLHSFKCLFIFCCNAVKHTPTQTLTCRPGKTADKLFRTERTKCAKKKSLFHNNLLFMGEILSSLCGTAA